MQDVKFCKGMTFSIIEEFKDVVLKYSVAQRQDLRFSKNKTNKSKG